MEGQILQIVSRLQRSYAGVYPYMVCAWLDEPYYRHESTVRRWMVRLANDGKLVRVDGPGARKGYLAAA